MLIKSVTTNKQSSKVLRGTIRATNNMISFDNFIWSPILAGVIGGVLGAMLTLTFKIFGEQGREQADEDRDGGTPTRRENLSKAITYLNFEFFLKWVSFLFFSSSATFFISKLLTRGATATATLLYSSRSPSMGLASREFSTVILRNQFRAQNLSEYRYTV